MCQRPRRRGRDPPVSSLSVPWAWAILLLVAGLLTAASASKASKGDGTPPSNGTARHADTFVPSNWQSLLGSTVLHVLGVGRSVSACREGLTNQMVQLSRLRQEQLDHQLTHGTGLDVAVEHTLVQVQEPSW